MYDLDADAEVRFASRNSTWSGHGIRSVYAEEEIGLRSDGHLLTRFIPLFIEGNAMDCGCLVGDYFFEHSWVSVESNEASLYTMLVSTNNSFNYGIAVCLNAFAAL